MNNLQIANFMLQKHIERKIGRKLGDASIYKPNRNQRSSILWESDLPNIEATRNMLEKCVNIFYNNAKEIYQLREKAEAI
jgi:hypothetical protein